MNHPLFVYGTLLSSSSHPMSNYLASRATLLGAARLHCACLYDLGTYPAIQFTNQVTSPVVGELYQLHEDQFAETIAALDSYEGIGPASTIPDLYERLVVSVEFNRSTCQAWTYVMHSIPESAVLVPTGDYSTWHRV
ncbi:MAG: gamma-glutamylcyclotransferase family protein [Zavarzinella sp.]